MSDLIQLDVISSSRPQTDAPQGGDPRTDEAARVDATGADDATRAQIARVETLLGQLEALPVPERETATEMVQALLDLYGEGLGRIVDVVAIHDDGAMAAELADDELVSHLLLLHGLHPAPVADRVRGALDGVLPYLESHGGSVELLSVQDGIVDLKLEGSCSGCPSSAMTLKLAIEDAIFKAAPDVQEVRADGAVAPPPQPEPGSSPLLQIECPSPLRASTA